MKPAIDNRAPTGFGASVHDDQERKRKDINRANKGSDMKKRIELGNKKIGAKITAIKHQTALEWKKKVSIVKKSPFNPFLEKRMKEQKRIQAENEKLLQKIEMVKTRCTYDTSKFVAEFKKKEAVKERISLYSKKDAKKTKPPGTATGVKTEQALESTGQDQSQPQIQPSVQPIVEAKTEPIAAPQAAPQAAPEPKVPEPMAIEKKVSEPSLVQEKVQQPIAAVEEKIPEPMALDQEPIDDSAPAEIATEQGEQEIQDIPTDISAPEDLNTSENSA